MYSTCEKKTEAHDGHHYEKEEEVPCSGKTECGAWSHRAHVQTKMVKKWCDGVCHCGMFSHGPHGPGEHK